MGSRPPLSLCRSLSDSCHCSCLCSCSGSCPCRHVLLSCPLWVIESAATLDIVHHGMGLCYSSSCSILSDHSVLPSDFPAAWRRLLHPRRRNSLVGVRPRVPRPSQQFMLIGPTSRLCPSHSKYSRDLPRETKPHSPSRQLLRESALVALLWRSYDRHRKPRARDQATVVSVLHRSASASTCYSALRTTFLLGSESPDLCSNSQLRITSGREISGRLTTSWNVYSWFPLMKPCSSFLSRAISRGRSFVLWPLLYLPGHDLIHIRVRFVLSRLFLPVCSLS